MPLVAQLYQRCLQLCAAVGRGLMQCVPYQGVLMKRAVIQHRVEAFGVPRRHQPQGLAATKQRYVAFGWRLACAAEQGTECALGRHSERVGECVSQRVSKQCGHSVSLNLYHDCMVTWVAARVGLGAAA